MIVGARNAGLSVSESADFLGFSRTTSLEFAVNGANKKKWEAFPQAEMRC